MNQAGSRAWSSHHAVLYKQTLCFYQDRKDTLRSSVCGLPLNLRGAACVPAPEYTKKPHCLSLRLRDGSEYLLSTTSPFSMKTWMLKIQANTEDIFHSVSMFGSSRGTSFFSATQPRCSISSGQDSLRNKRRSQSFSSARYQQINPVLPPPRGQPQDSKSSYLVPLVVGEKESETVGFDTSTISDRQNKLPGWQNLLYQNSIKRNPDSYQENFHQEDTALRSYMSLPRSRHKSVFRRFFGKKMC
ncbi:hypothetical protein UPYG_G00130790 [Umbra pygmaea]|uniref:PH domain-containing protein n=1 Tax=Umbra pygmaea TaxID=75934 RepID=A0ABD0WTR2_UMBPY